MNNVAPMRNCPGCKVGYSGCQSMRGFGKCKVWTAKYSRWGKSIQIGAYYSYIK